VLDTVADVIKRLPSPAGFSPRPAPAYHYREGVKAALAVASMKDHTTDEGWQIMDGLGQAGYVLCGHDLPNPRTDVKLLLRELNPAVVFLQDKREWDVRPGNFREEKARFTNVTALRDRNDVFKLTVLKDAHQKPAYHLESADEIGCHAWVIYYHPEIVKHVAPYVREGHLLRTYHTLDADRVPPFSMVRRAGAVISGAVSSVYPLRRKLMQNVNRLPGTDVIHHPGYHRHGSATPSYLQTLSRYKVSVCTASIYGYALRKMMESTACGCVVITNLPTDEVVPAIDGNLIRVPSDASVEEIAELIRGLCQSYDPERQRHYAEAALKRYDYRVETARLALEIGKLRASY
jgi:hypothetical protein